MRICSRAVAGFALAAALSLLGATPPPINAQSARPESALLSAIKLWGDIRYLDPQTPSSQQRLDMTFMSAEPKIRAATDRASYLAAMEDWLSVVNDPAITPRSHESVPAQGHGFTERLSLLVRNGSATKTSSVRGTDDRALQFTWTLRGDRFAAEPTDAGGYSGGPTYSLHSVDGVDPQTKPFGSYGGHFDVTPYLGKTIRVRGYLSTDNVVGGAGFWLRIDGPSMQLDNMQDRWLHGTTNWTPFTIVLHVPADATQAVGGVLMLGTGKVSASDIHVDIVPDSTPTTEI